MAPKARELRCKLAAGVYGAERDIWHAQKAAGQAAPGSAMPPADLLQDLCSRFILNCPAEELQAFERILFLVEQARPRRAWADMTGVHAHGSSDARRAAGTLVL